MFFYIRYLLTKKKPRICNRILTKKCNFRQLANLPDAKSVSVYASYI